MWGKKSKNFARTLSRHYESRGCCRRNAGNDAAFDGEHLTNSLVVWSADAIRAIESSARAQLSARYKYLPLLRPGRFRGEPYDLVMTAIAGNHVATVADGRIGPSAVIGDSALRRSKEAARAAAVRLVPELGRIKIGAI
jgi:hypothetical protein